MSDKKEVKDTSKRSKLNKNSNIAKYIYVPVIYTLVALIIAIPAVLVMTGAMDKMVSSISEPVDYYGVSVVGNDAPLSTATSGDVKIEKIQNNQMIGKLVCENAGINCDVYKEVNRVTLREGAGSMGGYPGCGSLVEIFGYSTTVFRNLNNVDKGDKITFSTVYGVYDYIVTEVVETDDYNAEKLADNTMILSCIAGDGLFANYGSEHIYVIAEQISGPNATEVTQ